MARAEWSEGTAPLQLRVSRECCYTACRMKCFWCCIMFNKSRRLYVGFTDDLAVRVVQHRDKVFPKSFTARYAFDTLVFYETYSSPIRAKMREKEIKGWRREKKLRLILAKNPDWADLSAEWQNDPRRNLVPEAGTKLKRKS